MWPTDCTSATGMWRRGRTTKCIPCSQAGERSRTCASSLIRACASRAGQVDVTLKPLHSKYADSCGKKKRRSRALTGSASCTRLTAASLDVASQMEHEARRTVEVDQVVATISIHASVTDKTSRAYLLSAAVVQPLLVRARGRGHAQILMAGLPRAHIRPFQRDVGRNCVR